MASGSMSSSRDGPDYGPGRKNQYFVPGEGIAREVITADICKYLDNDATVRPFNYQGREGYMLFAYRNLTSAMVDDLRRDTETWQREQRDRRGHRGPQRGSGASSSRSNASSSTLDHNASLEAYVDSRTHQSRQQRGPTVPDTPSPGLHEGYAPGRGPPPVNYHEQQPSPQHETQYGGMPPPSSAFQGSSRNQVYAQPSYGVPDQEQPRSMTSHNMTGYPADPNYGRAPVAGQFQGAPSRAYPPQPSSTVPPGASRETRDAREPRYNYAAEQRQPHRMDNRTDPRPDPRGDPRAASRMQVDPRSYPPERIDPRYPVDSRADPRYQERGFSDPRYRR